MSTIDDTQKRHLDSLVRSGAFQFTNKYFVYDSDEIGPYLFDTAAILEEGALWGEICKDIVKDITQKQSQLEFDIIAGGKSLGGKSMGWMFSGMASVMLEKPYINIYKDGSTKGASVENKNVLFIGDYLHAGSNIKKVWKPAIEKQGGKLIGTYFYMDKKEGGRQAIESMGVKHNYSFLELDDASWEYILRKNNLSQEIHQTMKEYRENQELWIRKRLTEILNHFEKSPEEEKILKSYPILTKKIKDEIYKEV